MASKVKEKTISLKKGSRWREIVGVLLTAMGLFLLISLASYNPQDVSLNSTGSSAGDVKNLGGVVGAHLADIIIQLLGWGGYLIPLLFLFLGVTRFQTRQWGGWLLRGAGGVGFLLSVCVLLQLKIGASQVMGGAQRDAGGIIGRLVAEALTKLLNLPGAYIMVLAVLLASLLVMTNLSLRLLGIGLLGLFGSLARLVTIRKERTRRRKAVTKAKAVETRIAPPRVVSRKANARGKRSPEPVQEEFEALPRPKGKFALPPLRLL